MTFVEGAHRWFLLLYITPTIFELLGLTHNTNDRYIVQ